MSQQPQPRKVLHLPKVRMLSRGRLPSGIRITNVRSLRPPNPDTASKQDNVKPRAKMQKEIVYRSRTCAYAAYDCWTPVLPNRRYCSEHILLDPTAPFTQCSYTYNNGERCPTPSPISDKDTSLCLEHARLALLSRHRSSAPPPPVISTETLLNQLQHYVKPERPRTTSCASSVSVVSDPAEQEPTTATVDPFMQLDATTINANYSAAILECGSGSDSECDSITLGPEGNCRYNQPSSDCEDVPTEKTPLWYAGVYTAEEAVSQTKSTLCALQSAYIQQMGRLKVLLQTARLQYLRSLKQEKEQYCSISSQASSGPLSIRERRQLRKLKAFASYHRKHGMAAVLARKLHHKRTKVNDTHSNRPIPSLGRCTFVEENVRCGNHVLPAAKHCLKHILHDSHQVLFKQCGDVRGLTTCREPLAKVPLLDEACVYHTQPPPYTVFTLKKDGSDSETESLVSSQRSVSGESPA